MKNCFLLVSHKLTPVQKRELRQNFNCDNIHYLSEKAQKIWSQISPTGDLKEQIEYFISYLRKKSRINDIVVVQGEYGMVFAVVSWCLRNGRIAVYSTSERVTREMKDKDETVLVVRRFKHVMFRKYEKAERQR